MFIIVTFHHDATSNGFAALEHCSLSFLRSNLYLDYKSSFHPAISSLKHFYCANFSHIFTEASLAEVCLVESDFFFKYFDALKCFVPIEIFSSFKIL